MAYIYIYTDRYSRMTICHAFLVPIMLAVVMVMVTMVMMMMMMMMMIIIIMAMIVIMMLIMLLRTDLHNQSTVPV